jgi:hypothetical protein
MYGVSAERIARNQAWYSTLTALDTVDREMATQWICECSDPACAMLVEADVDEYSGIRANGAVCIVHPSHASAPHDRVITRNGRFALVELTDAREAGVASDRGTNAEVRETTARKLQQPATDT